MRHNDHDNLQGNQIVEMGHLERGNDLGNCVCGDLPHSEYRKNVGLGVTDSISDSHLKNR
jgi:hypothetical protein